MERIGARSKLIVSILVHCHAWVPEVGLGRGFRSVEIDVVQDNGRERLGQLDTGDKNKVYLMIVGCHMHQGKNRRKARPCECNVRNRAGREEEGEIQMKNFFSSIGSREP